MHGANGLGPAEAVITHVVSNVDIFIFPNTFILSRKTPFFPMPKMSSKQNWPDLGFLSFPAEQFVPLVLFS